MSLDDKAEHEPEYSVSEAATTGDFNSYIVKNLALRYLDAQKARMALIKYYDWRFLVVFCFQRWVLRLFNRFWRRYNLAHDRKTFKTFRFYHQIIEVLQHTRTVTLGHLAAILDQENRLEQSQLRRKTKAREDKEEAMLLKDTGYNYWDTFEDFDADEEMMELDIDAMDAMEE